MKNSKSVIKKETISDKSGSLKRTVETSLHKCGNLISFWRTEIFTDSEGEISVETGHFSLDKDSARTLIGELTNFVNS